MTRASLRLPLLCGILATVVVTALDLSGALEGLESSSLDMRFRLVPRTPRPMTSAIVHVDIDDGALDVKRWPWKRRELARAVSEIARAGARTLVLDLLLTEESDEEDSKIDDDELLAGALASIPCVLPVDLKSAEPYDPAWSDAEGEAELASLLSTLEEDLLLDEQEVVARAGLTSRRRTLYLSRPLHFKRAAAGDLLRREGDSLETYADFEARALPRKSKLVGEYAGKAILESVFRQDRAWRIVAKKLLPPPSTGTFLDKAPLPVFAQEATAFGYVSIDEQKGKDGVLRSLAVAKQGPGGRALQFGLAAAVAHTGIDPASVHIDNDSLVMGGVTLPLTGGRLLIDWPTSTTRPAWEGFLRQSENDLPAAGHVSIREVRQLALDRDTLVENHGKVRDLAARILEFMGVRIGDGAEIDEARLAEVRDEVEFTLADAEGLDEQALRDEGAVADDNLHHCRLFREADRAVSEGTAKLAEAERTLRSLLEDKLVFLGWTATGALADFVPTALDARTPGVVVSAAIADMALSGAALRVSPPWTRPLLTVLLGLLCTIATLRASMTRSAIVALVSLTAFTFVNAWLFDRSLVLPMVGPLVAGGSSWILCTALQSALSQKERLRVLRQFKARVSTQLVDYLADNPEALSMSGEEREITILFSDLAGFTSIAESLGGPATVSTLNRYLGEMTRILTSEDAYLNKFLGDGFMAFWSAFGPDPDQAQKACRAAILCHQAVARLNLDPTIPGLSSVGLRIGVATGKVIVGDCGAPPALNDYTVIGDAVNLSSRLESANKQFGTSTLIDRATFAALRNGQVLSRYLGQIIVVGQSVPVDIHEVLPAETPMEEIELVEAVVCTFQERDPSACLAAIDRLEEVLGHRKIADVYRTALAEAGDELDGVLRLRAK